MAKTDNMPPGATPSRTIQTAESSGVVVDTGELLKMIERSAPDVLSSVPKDRRAKLVGVVASSVVSSIHCGPLPPPQDLAVYDQHIPGGADRIMKMAEKQLDHRIAIETNVISAQQTQSARGQWLGFFIGIFGISAGTFLSFNGHEIVGGSIAGATVISLVSVFVYGQRAQRRDLKRKAGN